MITFSEGICTDTTSHTSQLLFSTCQLLNFSTQLLNFSLLTSYHYHLRHTFIKINHVQKITRRVVYAYVQLVLALKKSSLLPHRNRLSTYTPCMHYSCERGEGHEKLTQSQNVEGRKGSNFSEDNVNYPKNSK